MQINFQTVNFKADQKLLDFITNKIEKLNKFENKIISVNVYLKVENTTANSLSINIENYQFSQTNARKSNKYN